MSKLFRRKTHQVCFYCGTDVNPRNPHQFRCSECGCLNRYDDRGEIISDEPAMHDETMNAKSFAKRASSRKDRLPSSYGDTSHLFCETCKRNQQMLSGMLSAYLPDPSDTKRYADALAEMPDYVERMQRRYTPVCEECLPNVEAEIRRRDEMARTRALGAFLKDSRGNDKRRLVETQARKDKFEKSLFVWKIRGCLWAITFLDSLGFHGQVAAGYALRIPLSALPVIPVLSLFSIAWTAWDPTYAIVKRSQLQGRVMRQKRKHEYNILQTFAWFSRLVASIILVLPRFISSWDYSYFQEPIPTRTRIFSFMFCLLELLILARSIFALRIQRPPAVHLRDDASHRPTRFGLSPSPTMSRGSTPSSSLVEPDLLGPLSISNKPRGAGSSNIPISHPIFGLPSFPNLRPTESSNDTNADENAMDEEDDFSTGRRADDDSDSDAMDWTPTNTPAQKNKRKGKAKAADDGSWLKPQRFFPPEEPTGLEHLFEKTITLVDDDSPMRDGAQSGWGGWHRWIFVCGIVSSILVPLAAWGYVSWRNNSRSVVSVDDVDVDS
ncbi:hypothetical protein QCA50_001957 [Cerrena zonata]|uniref:Ima1 N-terminal domain-containing protein n=1 Tax=Cerrena zonata TaxID=2478898 RepID=A0AAW0GSI5_9APHY